jgi:hypothetical protein
MNPTPKSREELTFEVEQLEHEAESITRLLRDLTDHLGRILDAKAVLRNELDSSYEPNDKAHRSSVGETQTK